MTPKNNYNQNSFRHVTDMPLLDTSKKEFLKRSGTSKTFRTIRALTLTGLSIPILICPCDAQEVENTDAYELPPYVSVANRFELPLDRIGSSVDYISSFDLRKTNQPFLLEALRLTPGFYLRNNGGPGGTFGITTRGLNTTKPTVMIDGIEVSNPSTGDIINFGSLLSSNVSSIEILKGAQGSLYGANSLAGVININSRGSSSESGGSIELSAGSYNTFQGSLSLYGGSEKLNWSINAGAMDSEYFSSQDPNLGPDFADDDGHQALNLSTKLEYNPTEALRLYLFSYYIDASSDFDNDALPARSHTDNEQFFAKVGGEISLSDAWQSQAGLAFSYVDTLSVSSFGPFSLKGERYKLDWQNIISANEHWTAIAGVEVENEKSLATIGEHETVSAFVENIFSVNEQLDLTLGARHDDLAISNEGINPDQSRKETTWRSSFSYRIDFLDTRIHASYGTAFQAPTTDQLWGFFGNENLTPESGDGWDLGIEKSFPEQKLVLGSSIFGYELEEHIFWDITKGPFGAFENNDYQSIGIETNLNWRVSESLVLNGSHTYTDAEFFRGGNADNPIRTSAEAERVPRNVYSLNANWKPADIKWSFNATVYHATSQYSTNASQTKQPGYTVTNLSLQHELNEKSTIWLRMDNLFDEDYVEIEGFQTAGFSAYGGLRWGF